MVLNETHSRNCSIRGGRKRAGDGFHVSFSLINYCAIKMRVKHRTRVCCCSVFSVCMNTDSHAV